MSKLIPLLKATMSGGIELFNYRGKTERSRRLIPLLLIISIGGLMLISATAMTAQFKEDNLPTTAILSLYTAITAIIILTEGVYKSGDLLFKPHDNDMLLAMPIKKPTIVLARIIKFYIFELLYCLIFLLPAIIAYAINTEVEPTYYLLSATMLVLIPVIPIAISCIVGLFISAFSSRVRHKVFLQTTLSFITLFIIAIFILSINTTSDLDGNSIATISDRITTFYYPASVFVKLTIKFNILQYLIFIFINLAVLTATIFIISHFYFQIVTRLDIAKRSGKVSAKYRFTKHHQSYAIVKKELTRYFSTPVLLVNTALGLVLFIVAVIAVCFNYDDLATSLISSAEDFPLMSNQLYSYLPSVAFLMIALASLMTFITATMISLEGKAFNALKSMPISSKKVIMSKVLAAMLLIVPITALGGVVMSVRFQFNIIDTILILIATVVMALVTELAGILINLKYPRFDAESDAVVVKQSASIVAATFLGLGMFLLTTSLTIATVFLAGQTEALAMIDAIFAITAIYLYFAVVTRGEERYSKLSA